MSETVRAKEINRTIAQQDTKTSVSTEVDKVIIVSIAAFAGLVGLWSVACLVSAMIQAGGPLQLAAGWFRAVSGM